MTIEERKAYIAEQITLWVGKHRFETLKAEELGRLQMNDKLVVMRNGLIAGCIRHCRLNPRAEAKIPILTLIMAMSDNAAGVCRLGVTRMAEILQRTKTCIINNIAALEADGLIGVDRKDGLPSYYWPLIPSAMVKLSLNPIWFVDTLSTKPKSRFKTPDEAIAAATEDGNRSTVLDRSTVANEPVNCSERTGQLQRDSISSNNSSKEEEGTDVPTPSPRVHGQQKGAATEGEVMHEVEAACADYNVMARECGFTPCTTLTDARRTRLGKRLREIGGRANFNRALLAIPLDAYLAGRKRPKDGKPFMLDIDYLLRADDSVGDVLAKLLDKAGPAVAESFDDEVLRLAERPDGQELIAKRGRDWAMQRLREIVTENLKKEGRP